MAINGAEGEHAALSDRVGRAIILTVGAVRQAAYEPYTHTAFAHRLSMAPRSMSRGWPLLAKKCGGYDLPGLAKYDYQRLA